MDAAGGGALMFCNVMVKRSRYSFLAGSSFMKTSVYSPFPERYSILLTVYALTHFHVCFSCTGCESLCGSGV